MRNALAQRTSCFLTAASTCVIWVKSRQSRKRIRWCSLMNMNLIELAILLEAAMQVCRSESMRRRCWS